MALCMAFSIKTHLKPCSIKSTMASKILCSVVLWLHVTLLFMALDSTNNFFVHVLPFLHELWYPAVNTQQTANSLFVPKQSRGTNKSLSSMCYRQHGCHCDSISQWSKRRPNAPFLNECTVVSEVKSLTWWRKQVNIILAFSFSCAHDNPDFLNFQNVQAT